MHVILALRRLSRKSAKNLGLAWAIACLKKNEAEERRKEGKREEEGGKTGRRKRKGKRREKEEKINTVDLCLL